MRKITHTLDSRGTKDKIIELFFEKHLRPTEIAKKLKIGMPYITKIIQKDSRYIREKENRKQENKEKSKTQKRIYAQNRRKKEKEEKQEYQKLLVQINRDNEYLSTKKKLSDEAFSNWNRGMFDYDKYSSDLVLKNGINVGFDVPKRVSNIVSPSCIRATV